MTDPALSQLAAPLGSDPTWWSSGVVYQIYPRSFADSNDDGLGDLPGIVARLDHLNDGHGGGLGVDAIWLSPIYPSPGRDVGYDVADHAAVDPAYGTLDDFDRLVVECHARGLRVILDLVMNHTSDAHPWFAASRASRSGPYADFYLWRDPAGLDRRGRPRPPNNWVSFFGGSAWEWEPRRGQFYLHTFLSQQPDVNFRNPAVRAAQWAMVEGWLARGVDGFRLDVFNSFLKAAELGSNPPGRRFARRPWDRQRHLNDKDQPELDALIDEFRAIVDAKPGRMSVGELFDGTLDAAVRLTRGGHLVFDFGLIEQPWSAAAFAAEIERREAAFGPARQPANVLSNHDRSRHVSRFLRVVKRRDAATQDALARASAVLLLTLRGTPFLYYGEEIGLGDVAVPREEIVDPPARRASWRFPWWNRDQCRAPMPWTAGPNGGFTAGRPWIRMAPDLLTRNVAAQTVDESSVLSTYRRLLRLRRELPVLAAGGLRLIGEAGRDVLVFVREQPGDGDPAGSAALVAINFATASRTAAIPAGRWRVRLGTVEPAPREIGDGPLVLRPLEAVVAELQRDA